MEKQKKPAGRSFQRKVLIIALLAGLLLWLPAPGAHALQVNAPEIVVMDVGDPDQIREFYLDGVFEGISELGPAKTFIFIGTGDNETQCGKLTMTLATAAKRDYGAEMTFSLKGFAYGLGGSPSVISASGTAPAKAAKSVTFNTPYGIAFITVLITDISGGDVDLPAPFTLTFSLAKK